jgi:hypothetical protein
VSNVHRLRVSGRIFFVSVNVRRTLEAFRKSEYPPLIDSLQGAVAAVSPPPRGRPGARKRSGDEDIAATKGHEKEFDARMTYLHFNPVRRELVRRPEDWRWSMKTPTVRRTLTVATAPPTCAAAAQKVTTFLATHPGVAPPASLTGAMGPACSSL